MKPLYGECLPVPETSLRALEGGERIRIGEAELEVCYTPGHASHHVTYWEPESKTAFVGDTAGIRRTNRDYIMPPTPPPDIDLDAWRVSEDRILSWEPDTLFLTRTAQGWRVASAGCVALAGDAPYACKVSGP